MEALKILQSLQWSDILLNVKNILHPTDEPWYRGLLWEKKPVPTPIVPLIRGETFVWAEPPAEMPLCKRWLICLLHVFVILALFSSRQLLVELPLRIYLRYTGTFWRLNLTFSLGSLVDILIWLFVTPFIIVLVRTTFFVATHTCYRRGLWLFPNLFSDSTFVGPFRPLYAWDTNPKESLGSRWRRFRNSMLVDLGLKRRRVNRTRRMSPRTRKVK